MSLIPNKQPNGRDKTIFSFFIFPWQSTICTIALIPNKQPTTRNKTIPSSENFKPCLNCCLLGMLCLHSLHWVGNRIFTNSNENEAVWMHFTEPNFMEVSFLYGVSTAFAPPIQSCSSETVLRFDTESSSCGFSALCLPSGFFGFLTETF